MGDSIVGVTTPDPGALLVRYYLDDRVDTVGLGRLTTPMHAQAMGNRWYVSDLVGDSSVIRMFDSSGTLVETIGLPARGTEHQFAVLPDGQIVVESSESELLVYGDETWDTFALAQAGTRPSHLVGLRGGVLHAVPGQHITLYNSFGNIRWRVEWPWSDRAYVSDIAVDPEDRTHFLAGIPNQGEGTFIVYSMVATTGEIERWSIAGPYATFVVSVFGEVRPDSAANWF